MVYYSIYESTIGPVFIASTLKGICRIALGQDDADQFFGYMQKLGKYTCDSDKNLKYMNQLDGYFKGMLREFEMDFDIKGTVFQLKVWNELKKIPYGQVRTYGDISRSLGMSCPRAVGQANKRNPLPIVIPCHRVVSSSGIGGYSGETSGSRVDIKKCLLELEGFDCSVL